MQSMKLPNYLLLLETVAVETTTTVIIGSTRKKPTDDDLLDLNELDIASEKLSLRRLG